MKDIKKDIYRDIEEKVEVHYFHQNLLDNILTLLNSAGLDINMIQPEDLAPIEEFHLRGREATEELTDIIKPGVNSSVLDVGCGIGGTCRYIASTYHSNVTGVDLSSEYIYTAEELTKLVGLGDLVEFYKGSALSLPFDDDRFDIVLSQHINMNIQEKNNYISEVKRVLKPGGKFGIYEIFRTGYEDIYYPVPWAEDERISYLTQWSKFEKLLQWHGFREIIILDTTQAAFDWIKRIIDKSRIEGIPSLSPQVFLGLNAEEKFLNIFRNFEAKKLAVIQAVYSKS